MKRKQDLSYIEEDLRRLAVPIGSLSFDPHQARDHGRDSVESIKASLRRHGFKKPIVVQKDGMVTKAGNGTLEAARELAVELGWTHVPVVKSADSADQLRAYALEDNRTAERAGWRNRELFSELKYLGGVGFGAADLGWNAEELAGIERLAKIEEAGGGEGGEGAEPKIDQADELRKKWGVELGQVWQLGDHRIICGDSTDPGAVTRVLDGEKPLLMVTDPPYGVEYDASWRNGVMRSNGTIMQARATGKVLNDDNADWTEAWKLFPGNVAYVWNSGKHTCVVAASLERAGFEIRSQIIWCKNSIVIGRGDYHWKHEPAWYAVRKGENGNWAGDRTQSTVWDIPKQQKSETGHSTQKPVECMARPMRNHKTNLVYEPFCGSGTAIIAAEQEGVRCFAVELNPGYVAVTIERYEETTGKKPVLLDG